MLMNKSRIFKFLCLQVCVILFFISFFSLFDDHVKHSSQNYYYQESSQKIDWNDYKFMEYEKSRRGFGEHGKGEKLEDPVEIAKNDELFKTFGMSVVISDKMSVNRSIEDFRHKNCLTKKYYEKLPKVSIVIIFVNEIFSVFKRTLHSLYNRTPHELIEEIILVNDDSTLDYLYEPLKAYVKQNFPGIKFQFIDMKSRIGLTKARVEGAKVANSEFLFIMEPHCEMGYNWLPPLLEPILIDDRIVTVPIVDYIEYYNIHHYPNGHGSRGVFDWNLEYNQLPKYATEPGEELDPFQIPVMTGGIYMIRKSHFFEIGPYDENLIIWGAENIEMSLKIHLCGGNLLEVPCSRVGHVFRQFNTFRKHESGIDFLAFNNKRIVEVWFDEKYKNFVFNRNFDRYQIDVGDLSKAKEKKKKLNCKPFQYFLDVIAPDLMIKFPPDYPGYAYGTLNLVNTKFCLDSYGRRLNDLLGIYYCHKNLINPHTLQNFQLTIDHRIRFRYTEKCLAADNEALKTQKCDSENKNQEISYDVITQQILFPKANKCVQANLSNHSIVQLMTCDDNENLQKWKFGYDKNLEY